MGKIGPNGTFCIFLLQQRKKFTTKNPLNTTPPKAGLTLKQIE